MSELDQILELWRVTQRAGESAVLATVVRTQGSSYRLPGARLLLTRAGQRAGSISGGCLEHDLVSKAWWLTEAGPTLRRYDTTPEGEIGSGFGLGCNGIVHVLLERLEPGQRNMLDTIEEVHRDRCALTLEHTLPGGGRFVETITPPIRLLIFGAGDDAIPLTVLARYLGWLVEVYDGRAHYARTDKFPLANRVSIRTPGAGLLSVDDWTVAVLMSHSYSQDLDVLRELASNPPRYVGVLGPRKRSDALLQEAGVDVRRLESVLHAPMGLDIGADGPQQVAIATIAEIQAKLSHREGGELRKRGGSIHARDDMPEPAFSVRSIVCA
ncbi:MAG: XdhC family protein [Acidobacteriaceae bacterium]|nr:XdhC family protein [Acidobacteriaceae bacterium]